MSDYDIMEGLQCVKVTSHFVGYVKGGLGRTGAAKTNYFGKQ